MPPLAVPRAVSCVASSHERSAAVPHRPCVGLSRATVECRAVKVPRVRNRKNGPAHRTHARRRRISIHGSRHREAEDEHEGPDWKAVVGAVERHGEAVKPEGVEEEDLQEAHGDSTATIRRDRSQC